MAQGIDAVLPLTGRDAIRAVLLLRSLSRFITDLGTLMIVVPDEQLASVRERIERSKVELPIRWVAESMLIPRLPLIGWYRQQLIKLAAAYALDSEFYLTLDADVVCTRSCNSLMLLPGGRARCNILFFSEIVPVDKNGRQSDSFAELRDWYSGAESVLGMKAVRDGVLHNVTPAVLSRRGVLEMLSHLDHRASWRKWSEGVRDLRQRAPSAIYRLLAFLRLPPGNGSPFLSQRRWPPWFFWLAASIPWAEYATYFTYLEATGRFSDFHFESKECIYDIYRSIWWSTQTFEQWNPEPLFLGQGPPFFAVIQSNSGLSQDAVWAKLSPWFGAAPIMGSVKE
jgi:hypothetical protein